MGKSVRELETWPNSEIQEWGAYYSIEPFGQERDNYHSATIASVVANSNRGSRQRAFSVTDFMYESAQESAAKQVAAFFGKFDKMKNSGGLNGD